MLNSWDSKGCLVSLKNQIFKGVKPHFPFHLGGLLIKPREGESGREQERRGEEKLVSVCESILEEHQQLASVGYQFLLRYVFYHSCS